MTVPARRSPVAHLLRHSLPGCPSAGAETELVRRAREGDSAARDELVRRHLRLAVHVARRYGAAGLSIDDLVQEGIAGLLKAVERYDGTRGLRFSNYAAWWIRSSVAAAVRAARSRAD